MTSDPMTPDSDDDATNEAESDSEVDDIDAEKPSDELEKGREAAIASELPSADDPDDDQLPEMLT